MITLEEICGYLPYGLKCHGMGEHVEGTEYYDNPTPKLFTATGIFKDSHGDQFVEAYYDGEKYEIFFETDFFPILRPMSDLTREIEHNGDKFVPIEKLLGITESDRNDVEIKLVVPKLKSLSRWEIYVYSPDPESSSKEWVENIPLNTYSWPFNRIQKLYSWHFWIGDQSRFGQDIIDINTLK